jgi:acyl-CoA dehydrogenase
MDFKLNDEQEEFRKLAKEFGSRELSALAEACDKDPGKAASLHQKIFESGLMNVQVPETAGGLALDLWNACLIAEGLAQGCSGIASAIEYSALAQLPLLLAGDEQQQQKCLAGLNDKLSFGGIALESLFESSCDVLAKKTADGYALSGTVHQLLNGSLADWFVIDAIDQDDSQRLTFLVEKSSKSSSISIKNKIFTVGRRAADIHSIELKQLEVSKSSCLIDATKQAKRRQIANSARCLISAGLVGVAQSAFEHAKKYANERQTFGKPIAQHQGIAFMMADMAKDIEAARELTWQAAILSDRGAKSSEAALAALLFTTDMAMRVTTDAVQVYGGYGYSKEYPVEKLMRDAKTYQCMIPSSHMLKSALGRELLAV